MSGRKQEFKQGFMANMPVAVSVIAYGGVLGILAAQRGLSDGQLTAMSLGMFAGSAQFVMIDMWRPPLPVLQIILAAAIVNLRYVLIGASLKPILGAHPARVKYSLVHWAADENWAMTMLAHRNGGGGAWHLLGGGLCLAAAWNLGVLAGLHFGNLIPQPERFGLDLAFGVVFTALAVSMARGRRDITPYLVAAAAAVLTSLWLPGKWFVVVGGLAGAGAAVWTGRGGYDEQH